MKIIFQDKVYDKPTVVAEFFLAEELRELLDKYGGFKYAFNAKIYDEEDNLILALYLNNYGNWTVDYSEMKEIK